MIENIELAVNSCRTELEDGKIPLPVFYEYVLPPFINNEPFENWRKTCIEEYDFLKGKGKGKAIQYICDTINNSLNKGFVFNRKAPSTYNIAWSKLKITKTGDCYFMAKTILFPLRALGIPATIDFIHSWGNYNGAHCWNVVYIDGKMVPFMGYEQPPYNFNPFIIGYNEEDTTQHTMRYPAKVFRKIFSINSEIEALKKDMKREDIPNLLSDSKIEDVTADYFPVTDITFDNIQKKYGNSVVYLSVFSNNWQLVAAGKTKNRKVVFSAMKKKMLYMLSTWKNKKFTPLSNPFIVDDEGNKRFLTPDFVKIENFEITTDYLPLKEYLMKNIDRVEELTFSLSYWDDGKWKASKRGNISNEKICFESVPSNTLFYFSDMNGKRIGRCFIVENGEPAWW